MAQAQVLEEIVNRRLVLAYARRMGDAPGAEELAKAKKQFQIRLAAQGRKVSDVLKAESMTAADLERQVLWQLVWDRYLARYCTPERRETWFQDHHRDLDGTELVVSHILLRPAAGAGPKEIEALEKRPNRSAKRSPPARSTLPRPRKNIPAVPAARKAAGWARSAATVRWTSRSPARPSN